MGWALAGAPARICCTHTQLLFVSVTLHTTLRPPASMKWKGGRCATAAAAAATAGGHISRDPQDPEFWLATSSSGAVAFWHTANILEWLTLGTKPWA